MRDKSFTNTLRLAENIMREGGNVLFIGDRGIGKSEAMEQIFNNLTKSEEHPHGDPRQYAIHNLNQVRDPSLLFLPVLKERPVLDQNFDPVFMDQLQGLPEGISLDEARARVPLMEKYLSLESLADFDRTYVAFDEVTDAGEAIHSFLLSVLLAKNIGGKKLRTHAFALAGTPPESSSASSGLSRPFLERAAVLPLTPPSPEEWLDYMAGKMPAWYAQFIRKSGSALLYVKEEEGTSEDFSQKASPRQHTQAAKMLKKLNLRHTDDDAFDIVQAYAGHEVATAFSAFISKNLEMYTFTEWQKSGKLPNTFLKLMYLIDDFVATVPTADERVLKYGTLINDLISTLVQFPDLYRMPVPHSMMSSYITKDLTSAGRDAYHDIMRNNKNLQDYTKAYRASKT